VRAYPGERPTISGDSTIGGYPLWINGSWAIYRDLEVIHEVAWPPPPSPVGIECFAPNVKIINCVVHNCGMGIGSWMAAIDSEIYGCLLYNNGIDKNRDHGIYAQNDTGTKKFHDNIIFNNSAFGIHNYTSAGQIRGFDMRGNVCFNNGSKDGSTSRCWNLFVGGGPPADRCTVIENYLFHPLNLPASNMSLNYGDHLTNPNGTVTCTDNYIAGGTTGAAVDYWLTVTFLRNTIIGTAGTYLTSCTPPSGTALSSYTWDNNTYYGDSTSSKHFVSGGSAYAFAGWKSLSLLDGASTFAAGLPMSNKVVVRQNAYDAKRANIIVYNWDLSNTVNADVSGILQVGDAYEVRNAQDYYATPVLTGTYNGSALVLPQNGLTVELPWGQTVGPAPTGPRFNCYVLLGTSATPPFDPPSDLVATGGVAKVTLTWSSVASATAYNVKRSLTSGGTYATIAPNLVATSYVDSPLTIGTTYYYVVSSVKTGTESANSNQVSAMPSAGSPGKAVSFDGSDDWIDVPDTSYGNVDWTYEAWIKTTSSSGWIVGKNEASDFRIVSAKAYLQWNTSGGFTSISGLTNVNTNTWRHIVGVRSGTIMRIYVDGALDNTGATSGTANPGYYVIGRRGSAEGYYFGLIDELRIYNRALSATEVANHYNSGLGQYGQAESNLVAAWHFDEGTGTSAADYSGNSKTGTLSGGVGWTTGVVALPPPPDNTPPKVLACTFDYFSATHKLTVQFSEDVSGSLGTADVQVQNLTNPGTVTVSGYGWNGATNTATFTFTPLQLPNANFRATLLASGITDPASNPLDGDGNGVGGDNYVYNFFFLKGDANHDRYVDIVDLGVVGSNWQQSPRGWTQGDFDYSGKVDIVDLGIVGTNWQTYLAPPPENSSTPSMAPALSKASPRRLKR
jgi:hypothetical protein